MRTRDLSANNINTLDSFGSANNATCILCLDNAFVCIQSLHLRIPPRVLHFSAIHCLLFKFRSGTHGLNEELGRHRGREGRKECLLCDAECESVGHVLWDCPAYVSIRSAFMLELRRELGDRFEQFQSLDSFEKSSYVLGSEVWEEYSSGLLGLLCA